MTLPSRLLALLGRMTTLCVVLLGVVAGTGAAAGAPQASARAAAATERPAPGPVVVVGMPGLDAEDLDPARTPHLWSMLEHGASASLIVRSVHLTTCPVDGWLTLGAGGRAAQPDQGDDPRPPCSAIPAVGEGGVLTGWQRYADAAARTRQASRLGSLTTTLRQRGDCVSAIGPAAAVGAADGDGRVGRATAYAPATLPSDLARCPVTLVDPGGLTTRDRDARAAQLAGLDARLGEVLAAAPERVTVIVAGLADDGPAERVRVVLERGPDIVPGTLRSSATRQDGVVLLTDLAPETVALRGGTPPVAWTGEAWTVLPDEGAAEDRRDAMVDTAQAAHRVQPLADPFFKTWAIGQLVLYLGALLLARRRSADDTTRSRLARGVRAVAVVAACVPAATYLAGLVPWWRVGPPLLTLSAVVAAIALVLGSVALVGPWRRHPLGSPAAVAALTVMVIAGDAVTGSHLTLSTLMGEQPTIGGRFYGLGNVAFALLATATLLLCVAVADLGARRGHPRAGALAALAIGLVAVVVDGSPSWGADLGGPAALLPAVAGLVVVALGLRLGWGRVLLVGVVTVLVLVGLAVADYLRPASSRTHLGRFVQTVLDGGAVDVVSRKAQQNLDLLTGSPLATLIPVGLALVVIALLRPRSALGRPLLPAYERVPLLRPGLICIVVMWLIGFVMNDSGTAIPAVGATVLVPLIIAIVLDARRTDQQPAPRP
ncbi:hypothetical protein GGG17_03920 [Arsenicicoccus sp. MKL-02]|uniref:Uncharacterized protein n=1 Tax=Arsenicicoccus cauae TaxID=2663847 RepID=A0A6I3I4L2_9MICO|nr:hypothetical protein [Arsenicicoccus cauae]MTB71134.1 hypothetical protein [Arsenicicoccus cauae]